MSDQPLVLRILWTTFGPFPQPLVSISVQGDPDGDHGDLLTEIGEHVREKRKPQGDQVEIFVRAGNVEDHVQIKANSVYWLKPRTESTCSPPPLVRWLLRQQPIADLPDHMLVEIAWMPQGSRTVHVQPAKAVPHG